MMRAGWMRFRASLMAMRRISWIDQQIHDGVAMLLFLPWAGVAFFFAGTDWRDGGSPVCTENLKSYYSGDEVHQGWRVNK
jgi:hypothetical protein